MGADGSSIGQPVGEPLLGHSESVNNVAFSPDGSLLASGGSDGTIHFWDIGADGSSIGQPVGEPLLGHSESVNSVAFSPDGSLLASGGSDGTIWFWDVRTGQPVGEPLLGHNGEIWSVAFSPDGSLLASGSADRSIRIWDMRTGQPMGEPLSGHNEDVRSVAFNPDGSLLVSGSTDDTVRLWDVKSGQLMGEPIAGHAAWQLSISSYDLPYSGHFGDVNSVVFSPNGLILASGAGDGTIRFWNMQIDSWIEKSCQRINRNLNLQEWQTYLPNHPYRATCPKWPAAVELSWWDRLLFYLGFDVY
jgi:WD40 repeat protein